MLMNLRWINFLFFTLIFTSQLNGQEVFEKYVSENSDTIMLSQNTSYFRFYNKNTQGQSFCGKGSVKQRKNKLIIITKSFDKFVGFITKHKSDSCKPFTVKFFIHDSDGNPISNVQLIIVYDNQKTSLFVSDSIGIITLPTSSLNFAHSIITNSFGFHTLTAPINTVGYCYNDITLEKTTILYSENEKIILNIKRTANGFILKQLRVDGLYDKFFQPILFKHVY